jgi:hypothetical protein
MDPKSEKAYPIQKGKKVLSQLLSLAFLIVIKGFSVLVRF